VSGGRGREENDTTKNWEEIKSENQQMEKEKGK